MSRSFGREKGECVVLGACSSILLACALNASTCASQAAYITRTAILFDFRLLLKFIGSLEVEVGTWADLKVQANVGGGHHLEPSICGYSPCLRRSVWDDAYAHVITCCSKAERRIENDTTANLGGLARSSPY